METDKRGLVVLATRVAEQLVATALEGLLTESTTAAVAIGTRQIKLTIRPTAERKLLGPAPRASAKPKAGKRKYTRRAKPAPPAQSTAAPPASRTPVTASAPSKSEVDISTRRCRRCKRIGTAQRVAGSDRELTCTKCQFTWTMRFKAGEGGAPAPPKPRGLKAASEPNACRRCDHPIDHHESSEGKCLVPRCACTELYQ